MKSKHKRLFHQVFKWWDYDFLLQAMELWFSEASKRTESEGVHKAHKRIAKRMKTCHELIRRIRNDNYGDNVVLFPIRKNQRICSQKTIERRTGIFI